MLSFYNMIYSVCLKRNIYVLCILNANVRFRVLKPLEMWDYCYEIYKSASQTTYSLFTDDAPEASLLTEGVPL